MTTSHKTLFTERNIIFCILRILPFKAVITCSTRKHQERNNCQSKSLRVVLTRELCFTCKNSNDKNLYIHLYPKKRNIFLVVWCRKRSKLTLTCSWGWEWSSGRPRSSYNIKPLNRGNSHFSPIRIGRCQTGSTALRLLSLTASNGGGLLRVSISIHLAAELQQNEPINVLFTLLHLQFLFSSILVDPTAVSDAHSASATCFPRELRLRNAAAVQRSVTAAAVPTKITTASFVVSFSLSSNFHKASIVFFPFLGVCCEQLESQGEKKVYRWKLVSFMWTPPL